MSRHNTRVFDLLVVKQGCLYMSEGGLPFQVKAGQALLLRPDSHHFSTDSCKESTSYYWLHFQTVGDWNITEDTAAALEKDNVKIENPCNLTNLISGRLAYACLNIQLCCSRPRWKSCSRS